MKMNKIQFDDTCAGHADRATWRGAVPDGRPAYTRVQRRRQYQVPCLTGLLLRVHMLLPRTITLAYNRQSVQGALESAQQQLKLCQGRNGANGLAIFAGEGVLIDVD